MQRRIWSISLRANRRYPGDWENEMISKFITAVALVAAFAMPAVARPVQATVNSTHGAMSHSSHGALSHSSHGAMSHSSHGAMSHSSHGATLSHGGGALTKTH
jgi:hypothetical protein